MEDEKYQDIQDIQEMKRWVNEALEKAKNNTKKDREIELLIGNDEQTLDQYLKRYWLWESREMFIRAPGYKCEMKIADIIERKEEISDSEFEKIVDARNYARGSEISEPKKELQRQKNRLKTQLNHIMGDIKLPSGNNVTAYDLLTCKSKECREMLHERNITVYDEKSCPLTKDNRAFFTWLLMEDYGFEKEKTLGSFVSHMKKNGVSCTEDYKPYNMIIYGMQSLMRNPKLLFTGEMVENRWKETFSYQKNNSSIVDYCCESLCETVKRINFQYPHKSSNNILIFEEIALKLEKCETEILELSNQLDKITKKKPVKKE